MRVKVVIYNGTPASYKKTFFSKRRRPRQCFCLNNWILWFVFDLYYAINGLKMELKTNPIVISNRMCYFKGNYAFAYRSLIMSTADISKPTIVLIINRMQPKKSFRTDKIAIIRHKFSFCSLNRCVNAAKSF